jgi:hypothetical protein
MVTRSRRVRLIDLVEALITFLRFAQERALFMVDGPWPRPDDDEEMETPPLDEDDERA